MMTSLCGWCLFILGATSIEKYDLRTNTWTQVANMSGRRLQFGVAVLEDRLYVVGGRDGLKTLNTVECYDLKKKVWTLMPPMSTHRHGLGDEVFSSILELLKFCLFVFLKKSFSLPESHSIISNISLFFLFP